MDTEIELKLARELVRALEGRDRAQANSLIEKLSSEQYESFMAEISRLSDELSRALQSVGNDTQDAVSATQLVPDIGDRLHYVVTQTEQAANKTLAAVETMVPQVNRIKSVVAEMTERAEVAEHAMVSPEEYAVFLATVNSMCNSMSGQLSEIMLAQSFQDLVGQVVLRLIDALQVQQRGLGQLLNPPGKAPVGSSSAGPDIEAQGPAINSTPATVAGQDEVDDLIAGLGL
ncbi:MAG: protein phosphatase CheZ [Gammaproteobacteria bacterium]|nr:protein phosphatase CheZ [Gammaproteobacteria bacterium]